MRIGLHDQDTALGIERRDLTKLGIINLLDLHSLLPKRDDGARKGSAQLPGRDSRSDASVGIASVTRFGNAAAGTSGSFPP